MEGVDQFLSWARRHFQILLLSGLMLGLLIPLSLTAARLASHVNDEVGGDKTAAPPPMFGRKSSEEEDTCGIGRPRERTEEELVAGAGEQPTASFLSTNARASAFGRLRERSAPYRLPAHKMKGYHPEARDPDADEADSATAV